MSVRDGATQGEEPRVGIDQGVAGRMARGHWSGRALAIATLLPILRAFERWQRPIIPYSCDTCRILGTPTRVALKTPTRRRCVLLTCVAKRMGFSLRTLALQPTSERDRRRCTQSDTARSF